MLRIGVCDDEADMRERIASMASGLASNLGIAAHIEVFASAEALLFGDAHLLDVVFLDVQMPHASGIDAARELRAVNPNAIIVLVTGYEEYAAEGYSVDARRFLLKPVSPQKFEREISPIFREALEAAHGKNTILVNSGEGMRAINLRNVSYLCTAPSKMVA